MEALKARLVHKVTELIAFIAAYIYEYLVGSLWYGSAERVGLCWSM
jgi:hypothetical protein